MTQITLPWPPSVLNPNNKAHWRTKAKAAKQYKHDCFYLAKSQLGDFKPAEGPITMHVTFCPPDSRKRDKDNAVASGKYAQDGLALAMGVDDHRFNPIWGWGDKVEGGQIVIRLI